MSANPSALDFNKSKPVPGVVTISGRLTASRPRDGGGYYHLLVLPAPDEYSHPATVEISSKQRIGNPGDVLSLQCRVSGVPNNFDYTDKNTGQRVNVRSARNSLLLVE